VNLLPHEADTYLEGIDLFHDHLVAYERKEGLSRIRISSPDGISDSHYVSFPNPVYTCRDGQEPEFDTLCCVFITAPW